MLRASRVPHHLGVGLLALIVACSAETRTSTVDPPLHNGVSLAMVPPAGYVQLSTITCPKNPGSQIIAAIVPNCIEIWAPAAPLTLSVGASATLHCDVWGVWYYNSVPADYPPFPLNGVNLIQPSVTGTALSVSNVNQLTRNFTLPAVAPTVNAGTGVLCALSGSNKVGAATVRVTPPSPRVPVSMSVSPASPISIAVPNQLQLTAHFVDQYGHTDQISPAPVPAWSSSNVNVATVSATGLLTAVGAGTATIQAQYGSLAPATVVVNVSGVTGVAIAGAATATIGFPALLSAQAMCGATVCSPQPTHSWSTSNPGIATVARYNNSPTQAVVTAVASGTVTITATAQNVSSPGKVITVYPAVSVSITGPGQMKPNTTCTWTANASAGVGPYTYVWYPSPSWLQNTSGTPNEFTTTMPASGSVSLQVDVTDSRGAVGSRLKTITINPAAANCGRF